MKKILLMIVMTCLLFIPIFCFAEGEEKDVDNRVHVYLFRGETCPHCKEAEEWLDSIQEEFGSKFVLIDYEVWNNEDNASLMEEVSTYRGDNATGVPYIVIGDKSWIGFDEETMGSEIKAQINQEFEKEVADRYDVMKHVKSPEKEKKSVGKDILSLIIILIVVGGICFGIYKARESSN